MPLPSSSARFDDLARELPVPGRVQGLGGSRKRPALDPHHTREPAVRHRRGDQHVRLVEALRGAK